MGHVPGVLSCELGRWPTLPQWSEAEGTPHLPLHAVQHLQDPVSPVTPLPEVGTASAPPRPVLEEPGACAPTQPTAACAAQPRRRSTPCCWSPPASGRSDGVWPAAGSPGRSRVSQLSLCKGKMGPDPFSCRQGGRGSQRRPVASGSLTGMHLPFRLGAVCGCVRATGAPEASGFETPAGSPPAPPPAPPRRGLPTSSRLPYLFTPFSLSRISSYLVFTKFCDHITAATWTPLRASPSARDLTVWGLSPCASGRPQGVLALPSCRQPRSTPVPHPGAASRCRAPRDPEAASGAEPRQGHLPEPRPPLTEQ